MIKRLAISVEIRHQFLDALIADLPGRVVMTMRADFLGNALSYRPFADVLNRKDYKLGPMNREELTDVIVKPAEGLGVGFEAGLVERILDDVISSPENQSKYSRDFTPPMKTGQVSNQCPLGQ
ncbi:hypothetical protein BI308_17365 [Roseofilum reptotaenium AO1-A]|uniref:Novel STAND NTPase 1 domain-containing protein n=1 Tax=Roseofilum reptotaenium AO1-A TaxID=1925591 RepID=A0A1L9QNX7_9CYAN|nr:hypothetical protein BI308_17365 [Roseofilum reptotaenium AO1-A]